MDIFSLAVEELQQLEVTVAARKSEPWLASSGTVYVVSRSDIENYGWRDLKEILASIPNMDYFYQWSWLPGGQRGFTGNMSGTLMLIDGREVQNLLANEAFIMNNFPSSRIERVEVLQGPNSTLYGGNAAQGVINVITRLERDENELHVLGGEVGTRHGHLLLNHKNGDFSASLSASYFESDQDYQQLREFVMNTSEFSRSSKDRLRNLDPNAFRNNEQNYTLDTKLSYQSLYFGANISRAENVSGIEAVTYDYITGDDSRRGYANYYLGKNIAVNAQWQGNVELSYFREYKEKDRLTTIVPEGATRYKDLIQYNEREDIGPSDRVRFTTQWQYNVNESADFIFGYDGWRTVIGRKIKYRDVNGDIVLFTPAEWAKEKEKSTKHAVYAQYSKTFMWDTRSLKLSAGLRYNQQDFTNSAYLPRASLVYQSDESQAIKLTYGEAFRPPTIFEFDLVVDDELESQTMQMTELNWSKSFVFKDIKFASIAALYHMKAENFYEKILDPTRGIWQTEITGEHRIYGLETQLKFQARNWQGQLSYRYIKPDEERVGTESQILDVPKYKLKFGLVYRLNDTWRIAGFADHWAATYTESNVLSGKNTGIEKIDAWTTLNMHLFKQTERFSYGIYIENVFDTEYFHSNGRGTSPTKYLQAPRNIRLQFSYKF
ncbi:TonB-dependent receptor plug domain-containing protein [Pseudoalteromonas sp. S16_S37]|uniref:TonB-dependent receptor plug domain-containing protein n=1 Tax=Pseudoalteromonas sp. S16_S37 TaxID=2720228 RepID=UPI001680C839|nr:TonB-dependent receptor [Pseudoalteromonas sp. S16_S37]MBD1581377.1 TonB-dependent receptor [Pseudoalteromonas sp. S16_S37]